MNKNNVSTLDGALVKVHYSPFGSLTLRDWLKGAVMAVGMAGLTSAQQFIEHGDIFNEASGNTIALAALGGLVTYLLKNFFSDTTTVKDMKPPPDGPQ